MFTKKEKIERVSVAKPENRLLSLFRSNDVFKALLIAWRTQVKKTFIAKTRELLEMPCERSNTRMPRRCCSQARTTIVSAEAFLPPPLIFASACTGRASAVMSSG